MTEDELQAKVTAMCDDLGLVWFHPPAPVRFGNTRRAIGARPGMKGWVDLTILGPGGSLFAELKGSTGRRSCAQIAVANALTRAGLAYRLWYPMHLDSGAVAAELEAIA